MKKCRKEHAGSARREEKRPRSPSKKSDAAFLLKYKERLIEVAIGQLYAREDRGDEFISPTELCELLKKYGEEEVPGIKRISNSTLKGWLRSNGWSKAGAVWEFTDRGEDALGYLTERGQEIGKRLSSKELH